MSSIDSESWIGLTLIDDDDRPLGTIDAIYFDQETGLAEWMAVDTDAPGTGHSFVPLANAAPVEDAVRTPYEERQIAGGPRIEAFEDLPEDEVAELYRYYGLAYESPVAEVRDVVVLDPALAATDPRTQAEDDMLVATGRASYVEPVGVERELVDVYGSSQTSGVVVPDSQSSRRIA